MVTIVINSFARKKMVFKDVQGLILSEKNTPKRTRGNIKFHLKHQI